MRYEAIVGAPDAGRRVDRVIGRLLGGVPPSLVQRLLRKGKVRINGRKAKPGDRLQLGDEVVVHHVAMEGARAGDPADASDPGPTASYGGPPLSTLYRDEGFLVVDKPAGLPCQPTGTDEPSVLGWALQELSEDIAAGLARPDLAHRLDRGTTGAVTVSLTAAAADRFRQALEAGRVEKRYLALVWGRPEGERFDLDQPLLRKSHAPRRRPKVVVASEAAGARPAVTRFEWLAAGPESSLLAAWPLTGRTHQIRAHLHAARLPVVGDQRYGDPRLDRNARLSSWLDHQLLHAQRLELKDDEGGIAVSAPLPKDMRRAARILGIELPASID